MDSQQSFSQQQPVKKVLVKRVKVLVKRPVAAAPAAAPAAAQPTMVKVPVKRPVQPAPQPTQSYAPPPPAPVQENDISPSGRRTFSGQVASTIETQHSEPRPAGAKPLVYDIPDDILAAVGKYKKIPHKAFALYIYTYAYAKQVAERNGRSLPRMMIELPEDTFQIQDFLDDVDDDNIFNAILSDFAELAPFVKGLPRVLASTLSLEDTIANELDRIEDQGMTTTADQIILAYLSFMIDMYKVRRKMEMQDVDNEIKEVVDDIKEMDEEENDIKKRFIDAIQRKKFPVDAEKLVSNYFNLARKDPDKAYETLITNPLFFSPIQLEKLPKKLFGLVKPSAKDAISVNKQLASFFKHLKI